MLLQAVDRGDVVGRHPTLAILGLCLAPLAIVVVTQHTQLLSCFSTGDSNFKFYAEKFLFGCILIL